MEQELKDEWAKAMDSLMSLSSDKRRHFALLLVSLAKCYADKDNWKAVILIHNDDALLTFSAGADEYEAAGMLQMANDAVTIAATAGAPDKGMMN